MMGLQVKEHASSSSSPRSSTRCAEQVVRQGQQMLRSEGAGRAGGREVGLCVLQRRNELRTGLVLKHGHREALQGRDAGGEGRGMRQEY
jgi:hypothetical protein